MRKSIREMHNDIQAIIRQITTSVTFFPLLIEPYSFDLLVYNNLKAIAPKKWEESDPRYIIDIQEVKLRSFSTSVRVARNLQGSRRMGLIFFNGFRWYTRSFSYI